MKIAMLGWEYPPFKAGGLATHCYGLTHSLADRDDVHVDFFMPKTRHASRSDKKHLRIIEVGETQIFPYDRPDSKELSGQFFEAVDKYNKLVVAMVKKLVKTEGKYDLIHAHDWLTMKAAAVLKEDLGIPMVVTVHSTEYDRSGWLYPNQWFIDIEKQGMEKADKVIAVSHFTKRVITEKYGIPSEKVAVIHNAVYPIPEGEKQDIVLFLGRLTIQKGAEFFLRAAKKVAEYEPSTRFVVAGTGDMLPRLISQALDLGISDRVIFTGRLTDEEVKHIYGISSVYVMPSVSEPFGITALEAISAGTPTIASKTAGFSEVFNHCLRVDFWDTDEIANKVISLLRYPPLRKTLVQHGKKEIKLFTWDRVAEKTIDVYRGVL
ncbi:MAG: glycosyltransferase family 1 protein [Thermoplasmata archaeon]|nr:MAG: glycosyltransferase family 1 protein [Thermoplasmata archaeon]RLF51409.1 MAG: glycosyltransferase family 1 protein [Thermoplasmata archaeon]